MRHSSNPLNSDEVKFGDFVSDYERIVDPLTLPIGRHIFDLAGLVPGSTVVDVAAGTGAIAVEAAHRGIAALAVDIAPAMVARAAQRLAAFPAASARVMSFDALDLPDSVFDAAISIVGVLAFAGGDAGLREMARVTRSGGLVAAATWDQERPAAPHYFARDVFATLFPTRELWPVDFFPVWSHAALEDALRASGCKAVQVTVFDGQWHIPDPAEVMVDARLSISRLPGYGALDLEERRRFDRAITAAVLSHVGADGVANIPTRAMVGIGIAGDQA